MKTSLSCLGLLIIALLVGKRQQAQIMAVEQQLAAVSLPKPMKAARRDRDDPETNYRTKYQKRSTPLRAPEVFETVVKFLKPGRSVTGGSAAVMENREAFRAIIQLDLAGQEELIRLIAQSDDPKFRGDSLYKCEQINLCLSAMADRHPGTALAYLKNCDEKIGSFYSERMEPGSMVHYAILRLCDHDPQAGLEALVEQANQKSDSWSASTTAQLLATVAKHEPELVIETMHKLPVEQRPESLRIVLSQVETNDEATRIFNTLRNQLSSDSASTKATLTSLCENIANREKSWDPMFGWLGNLNLSDKEKLSAAYAVNNGMSKSSLHGQELAAKLLDYLPPSKERNYLVWRAMTVFASPQDTAVRSDFLKQQGINHEEMLKLDRDEYLRQ